MAVEPEQPVDVVGRHVGAQPRHRPDERHRRARPSRRRPERPGPRQELEIVRRMHPPRRREVVLVRRQHRPEPDLPHPRQHDLRPPRQLEGRHDRARHQLDDCRHGRHGAANRPSASEPPVGARAYRRRVAGRSAATGHALEPAFSAGSASRAASAPPPACQRSATRSTASGAASPAGSRASLSSAVEPGAPVVVAVARELGPERRGEVRPGQTARRRSGAPPARRPRLPGLGKDRRAGVVPRQAAAASGALKIALPGVDRDRAVRVAVAPPDLARRRRPRCRATAAPRPARARCCRGRRGSPAPPRSGPACRGRSAAAGCGRAGASPRCAPRSPGAKARRAPPGRGRRGCRAPMAPATSAARSTRFGRGAGGQRVAGRELGLGDEAVAHQQPLQRLDPDRVVARGVVLRRRQALARVPRSRRATSGPSAAVASFSASARRSQSAWNTGSSASGAHRPEAHLRRRDPAARSCRVAARAPARCRSSSRG